MPAQTAEAKSHTPLERIGSGAVRFGADLIGHTDIHRIPKRRDRAESGPGKVAVGFGHFLIPGITKAYSYSFEKHNIVKKGIAYTEGVIFDATALILAIPTHGISLAAERGLISLHTAVVREARFGGSRRGAQPQTPARR
ncbi:MAG TPA: hypothetical protein VF820_05615 [Patescibacteria group bacterium]